MTGIVYRHGTDRDRPYFADSIRRGLKGSVYGKSLSNSAISSLIDPVLATALALVAVPETDPESILAFVLYAPELPQKLYTTDRTVYWVQVRKEFRRRGLATKLMASAGIGWILRCPFMVTTWAGGRNFTRDAAVLGYRLKFRPYDVFEIMAELDSYKLGDI
jgi:GNAT superfamily N-acetyltransferase